MSKSGRLSVFLQIGISLLIISSLNYVLLCVTGYFEIPDWNWDMERILPFTHLNRLEEGLSIWEIKLQRLPGLFPLYPLVFLARGIVGSRPEALITLTIFISSLVVQCLVVCLAFLGLRLKKQTPSVVAISATLMVLEIFLSIVLPSYKQYINAAFRLNWHGDTSLINILVFYVILCLASSKDSHRLSHIRPIFLFALATISFLGSLTSSLFIIIAIIPGVIVLLANKKNNYSSLIGTIRKPAKILASIKSLKARDYLRSPIRVILGGSFVGVLVLRALREGCTPTIIGDSAITRSSSSTLFNLDSPTLVLFVSLFCWMLIYGLARRSLCLVDKRVAEILLALHASIPILIFIYVFTSWGDPSVLHRYSEVYAFMLPLGLVLIVFNYLSGQLGLLVVIAFSSALSMYIFSMYDSKKLSLGSSYKNILHSSLLRVYLERGITAGSNRKIVPDVLVTDGVGHISTAPVLELLSLGNVRYSQLAGVADPRLFDQSPEEFVKVSAKSKLRRSALMPDDIRNYEYIVSTRKSVASQINLLGKPNEIIPLGAIKDQREYVLLHYKSPNNHTLKSHFASYLNRHKDVACKTGVSWPRAVYLYIFSR